jgi:hypothetical protein
MKIGRKLTHQYQYIEILDIPKYSKNKNLFLNILLYIENFNESQKSNGRLRDETEKAEKLAHV